MVSSVNEDIVKSRHAPTFVHWKKPKVSDAVYHLGIVASLVVGSISQFTLLTSQSQIEASMLHAFQSDKSFALFEDKPKQDYTYLELQENVKRIPKGILIGFYKELSDDASLTHFPWLEKMGKERFLFEAHSESQAQELVRTIVMRRTKELNDTSKMAIQFSFIALLGFSILRADSLLTNILSNSHDRKKLEKHTVTFKPLKENEAPKRIARTNANYLYEVVLPALDLNEAWNKKMFVTIDSLPNAKGEKTYYIKLYHLDALDNPFKIQANVEELTGLTLTHSLQKHHLDFEDQSFDMREDVYLALMTLIKSSQFMIWHP